MEETQVTQSAFDISSADFGFLVLIYLAMAFLFAVRGAFSYRKQGKSMVQGMKMGAFFALMIWGLLVIIVAIIK